MTDHPARAAHDDTVERDLADDLLGSGDESDPSDSSDPSDPKTESSATAPVASTWPDLAEDEDYLAPAARRGKLTTGLLVALIFLVGVLVGTVLAKTLSPAPAPQIVYVLNDAGTSAPAATPSAPR